jgi:hypothetical protein
LTAAARRPPSVHDHGRGFEGPPAGEKEIGMNRNVLKGQWMRLKGKIRKQWVG